MNTSKYILFSLLLLLSFTVQGQNFPQCDTLIIDCCTFDSPPHDSLTVLVSNSSTELFVYPGFILFDSLMDTVGMESVFYFGIGGGGFQPHIIPLSGPLTLPFDGFLELHTGFYDTLACSWPIHIEDTIVTSVSKPMYSTQLEAFPNPTQGEVEIRLTEATPYKRYKVQLFDVLGKKLLQTGPVSLPYKMDLSANEAGIYIIRVQSPEGELIGEEKMILR